MPIICLYSVFVSIGAVASSDIVGLRIVVACIVAIRIMTIDIFAASIVVPRYCSSLTLSSSDF